MATLQELGTVRLRLRLGGEDYQETLHAVQGDTGRVLQFDVLDGDGTVVTDLAGVTPVLFVRRPDGKEVGSATGAIFGGIIRITIPSSLLAYAGEAKAQIQLVDSANQHKLHDHLYRLQIEESLEAGASPGENLWFSLAELTEAIEEVHLLVEQYDTDVAAVATMRDDVTTKHSEVTTMHGSLQDVYDTEQARRTAETARIQQWQTWEDLIEEGAMPNATSTTAGAVKVDAMATESAPYTAVTTGKLASDLTGKVDKISGKGLSTNDYSNTAKSKVDAIPASPKYTDTVTTINGKTGAITKSDITALGIPAQDTVYTHPSKHPASMIEQDAYRRMVSDVQIMAWNSKLGKSGGEMTGALVAQPSDDTRQMRNITINTTAPTSTTGHTEGDIWLVVP